MKKLCWRSGLIDNKLKKKKRLELVCPRQLNRQPSETKLVIDLKYDTITNSKIQRFKE